MTIKNTLTIQLVVVGMMVAPAVASAQTPPKDVPTPAPSGQMVSPDQAYQQNKAPPLSDLRAKRAAGMTNGPDSAVRTPTPNGQMIHKGDSTNKPQP